MAGGVEALPHDDAIDTLNQFAEMQKYTPSVETEVSDTYTKDINPAAMWASWDEEARVLITATLILFSKLRVQ